MNKIVKINEVIRNYFELNKSVKMIPAKELMPYFIKAEIFQNDHRDGLRIRSVLRDLDKRGELKLIPYLVEERKTTNTKWYFNNIGNLSKEQPTIPDKQNNLSKTTVTQKTSTKSRDEDYIIDLCDELLKAEGSRQHRFDFLLGDPGKNGRRTKLPVDVYYETLYLVIEFKEIQHTQPVKHFDKPDKLTISGVHRGEQRKKYDQLRMTELPKHGIRFMEIFYDSFDFGSNHKIKRDRQKDLERVRKLLEANKLLEK